MIIKEIVKINNKLEEIYFLIKEDSDFLNIILLENQITSKLIEIPCVNKYDAIYFMNIEFPLKFKKIEFDKKTYILNERFMEHCFKTSKMKLDFLTNILTKKKYHIISEIELENNNFHKLVFQNLIELEKDQTNLYNFQLNKSLFILYLIKNYTNKSIKQSQFSNFITKKDILYTNLLKNYKISFKQSALLSIDTHIKIIFNNQKKIAPCYYFLANNQKFRKVFVNKINSKNIEVLVNNDTDIISLENIQLYFYPPKLYKICTINDLFSDIIKEFTKIKHIYINRDKNNVEDIIKKPQPFCELINDEFKKYSFPIKYNRRTLDKVFENIIYISIINLDKCIVMIDNKLYLHPEIITNIPSKVKTLYFNILKIFYQSKNNNFESIYFNTKLYVDSIHFEVLKIICERKTILNKLQQSYNLEKIINNFKLINKLRFAANLINWKNIPKKTSIFSILLKNKNLIFYKDRINKNILSDTCDNRLKKIIRDPLDMFKYLKTHNDYIRWINIIESDISKIYYNQFNVSSEDYIFLGKIMYRINNVTDQTFSNKSYNDLLAIAKKHKNLIIDNYRINIKIKEYLSNPNLNLGYLAKHINSSYNDPTSFSSEDSEVLKLKNKLNQVNEKYYKYKNKYHKLKTLTNTETVYNTTIDINNSKDLI
tara:strand:- start:300 stop:2264 length:1965 start_codon:yes stop_codon:yes gene_type:complete